MFENFIIFIFNQSVYPLISSTLAKSGPLSELDIWHTLKNVICLILSYALFLLLCHSHMNLNVQDTWPPWSSTFKFSLAVFYLQSLPWEGLNKPWGDPDSSISCHFSLFQCPPLPVSSASKSFICEASSSIFCVLLRPGPRQSLLTVCFWMFALSAGWPVLQSPVPS